MDACTFFFPFVAKFRHYTSKMVESFKKWISTGREKSYLDVLIGVTTKVMTIFIKDVCSIMNQKPFTVKESITFQIIMLQQEKRLRCYYLQIHCFYQKCQSRRLYFRFTEQNMLLLAISTNAISMCSCCSNNQFLQARPL